MAFQEKKFLDAEGVTHLVKLLDEYPNNQILGSVIDAIEGELAEKAEKNEIPAVPVQEVQVNGTSVLQNGVANVPAIAVNQYGVAKIGYSLESGLEIGSTGNLRVSHASASNLKAGNNTFQPITPDIQHGSVFYGLAKAAGDTTQSQSDNAIGTYTDEAKTAIQSMLDVPSKSDIPEVPVKDVQADGVSVLQNGVANLPMAKDYKLGLVRIGGTGININKSNGEIYTMPAESSQIKNASANYAQIVPSRQHESVFYGLAKAAGDTTQSASSNAIGTYTDEAKAAIQTMLGIDLSSIASQVEIPLVETVSGAAVTITGQPNTRYMCGEVTSISITPPAAGSIDVVFTSGSTVAVLTLPSTVKMPEWFDATTLDTNTVYEILITDGVYGSVMTWAT